MLLKGPATHMSPYLQDRWVFLQSWVSMVYPLKNRPDYASQKQWNLASWSQIDQLVFHSAWAITVKTSIAPSATLGCACHSSANRQRGISHVGLRMSLLSQSSARSQPRWAVHVTPQPVVSEDSATSGNEFGPNEFIHAKQQMSNHRSLHQPI